MTAGQFAYKYFFKPTLPIRYNLHHFGLKGWYKMAQGEREMKKSALKEPPITICDAGAGLDFSFLTGKNYWHQTIYAIKSLHLQIPGQFGVKIYSDGSLDSVHIAAFKRFAPKAVYVDPAAIDSRLDRLLPKDQFPALRFFREWHPFFKRMIDIHCAPGWNIHLDSDMLFLHAPNHLLDASRNKQAIYMQDTLNESYFVDQVDVLENEYGINCLKNVNGGIIAYNNDLVDYIDLEQKAQILKDKYMHTGAARVEQTLMSYMLYKQNAVGLDPDLYTIFFDDQLQPSDEQVVRHYIFKAKLFYLNREWKNIL